MASAGGHWVKATSGPYAGKANFVPATKSGITETNSPAGKLQSISQGGLVAVQHQGKWYVYGLNADGSINEKAPYYGQYASKQLAKGKMTNMNAAGYAKAKQEPDGGLNAEKIGKVGAVVGKGGVPATAAAPKTAKTSKLQVTEPGVKNIKAETAAAQAQAKAGKDFSTQADFDANKGPVTITTSYYKNKVEVDGVIVGDKGEYAVTYNKQTGKYHVVEMQGGTTVSTHDNVNSAFSVAKTAAASNKPAAANPAFKDALELYGSDGQANAVFAKHFEGHYSQLTKDQVNALASYQDSQFDEINGHLWGTGGSSYYKENAKAWTAHIDKAMAKSPGLPHDTVLYRTKHGQSDLYKWAQNTGVGGTYESKGFDSTSLSRDFSHGQVTLKYRAPKGLPGFFMNTNGYNSSHPGEYEYLLPRNLKWNVVGKVVKNGVINIELEFGGTF